jgi:hypothetical protein
MFPGMVLKRNLTLQIHISVLMGSDNLPAQVSDQERMMKKPGQKRQHHG